MYRQWADKFDGQIKYELCRHLPYWLGVSGWIILSLTCSYNTTDKSDNTIVNAKPSMSHNLHYALLLAIPIYLSVSVPCISV